jgi:hypothetical protein
MMKGEGGDQHLMRPLSGICSILAGLGIVLSPWHSFHPFPLGQWADSALPLFTSGALESLQFGGVSAILLPPFGGILYAGLLFLLLTIWRRDLFGRITWLTILSVASLVLLGASAALPDTLASTALRVGLNAVFGLSLVLVGASAARLPAKARSANRWGSWLFVVGGALIGSFVLLPLGLLLLAAVHIIFGWGRLVGVRTPQPASSGVSPHENSSGAGL